MDEDEKLQSDEQAQDAPVNSKPPGKWPTMSAPKKKKKQYHEIPRFSNRQRPLSYTVDCST